MVDEDSKQMSVIYHPAHGDPETVTAFGKTFKAGEAIEVDPKYHDKVSGNPHFEIEGEKTSGDDKRSEPVPEVEDEADNLTFEENVVANRVEEYGTADAAEAERMKHLAETSFDRPLHGRRRPGRPSKEDLRARQQQEEAKARASEHDADMEEIREEQTADEAEEQRRRDEVTKTRIELGRGALTRLGKAVAGETIDDVAAEAVDVLIDPMLANLRARSVIYIADADEIPDEAFNPLRLRLAWEAAGEFSVPYEQLPDCTPMQTEGDLRALGATSASDVVEFEDF